MKLWIKAATIRAIRTVAQTMVAIIGTSVLIEEVTWPQVFSAAALAGILSLLSSVAGLPEVNDDAELKMEQDKLKTFYEEDEDDQA